MFSFARYVVHSFGLLFFSPSKKRTTFATLAFALSSHRRHSLLSFHFFSFKIRPQLRFSDAERVPLFSCKQSSSARVSQSSLLPPASSLVSCLTWPATRILMSIFMLDRQHSGPKDHLVLTAAGITSRRWMGVFASLWLTFSRLFLRFMLLSCVHIWLLFCETQGN